MTGGELQVVACEDEPPPIGEYRCCERKLGRSHLRGLIDDQQIERREDLREPIKAVHRPTEGGGRGSR